jgi:hypothetical protein
MWHPVDTGVVITMAGAGSRFAQAGYKTPKYAIEVHGRTLFAWSMESLRSFIDARSHFTFIALRDAGVKPFIEAQCAELDIREHTLIEIDAITDGQATTAMHVMDAWDDPSRPLAIYNIDTYVRPAAMSVFAIRGNGWIPCFPGEGDKWSFAAADAEGRISEVREKKRISPHASVGLYWFDSFATYATAYEEYYADPKRIEGRERYIAPLYNQLIAQGGNVYLQQLGTRDVHPLGTPDDVERFAAGPRPDKLYMASGT